MEPFSDKDIATEILSRLPVKSLLAFKCTCKRWYNFVSDPSFLRIHYQRVKETAWELVGQSRRPNIDAAYLLNQTETRSKLKDNVLDFLPERVVCVSSSSNGILCCQSLVFKNYGYICNPVTREWVQLRSKGHTGSTLNPIGLAFYPFRSSSSSSGAASASEFKLVNMKSHSPVRYSYSFDIYSSDTKKWETSKEVCMVTSQLCMLTTDPTTTVIFTNGWFHWLTVDNHIIAFHVENEMSKVIQLPFVHNTSFRSCLGESKSYVHYVYGNRTEIQVWVLKNYEEPVWKLVHSLNIQEFCEQHSSFLSFKGDLWRPRAFYDDVVCIMPGFNNRMISYNLRTKRMINDCDIAQKNLCHSILIPHCVSLVPLHEPVRRSKRNTKRKLQEE